MLPLTIVGVFHQLDTIVYPNSKAKPSRFSQFTDRVWSIISGSRSSEKEHPQFTVPNCSLMLKMSLDIHLQPSKDIFLRGTFRENYTVSKVANNIVDMFNMFMSRCVLAQHGPRVVPWQDDSVRKVSATKYM